MSVTSSITRDAEEKLHPKRAPADGENREPGKYEPGRSSRKHTSTWRVSGYVLSILPPLVLAGILLASWYVSTAYRIANPLFLPAPAEVFASLVSGITSGLYLSNMLVTIQESVVGFLVALAIALPLGYGLAKSRLLAVTIHPYLAAGQAIPAIVIAPVLVIWLGFGWITNMIVCVLVVLFPIVVNTILGIQTIEPLLIDAARVEGASGWSLLRYVEFPLALPAILAAVRTGFTLSIVGALVGEFVQSGDTGLGALILIAKNQYNTAFMFATIIVLAVLAALYYGATWIVTRVANAMY